MANEVIDYLKELGAPYSSFFAYHLNHYFATGEEPKLKEEELRDLWFYLKVHELASERQREKGYRTFSYIELRDELDRNAKKFENNRYQLKKGRKYE